MIYVLVGVVAAVTFTGLASGAAQRATPPPGWDPVPRFERAARAFWHRTPCRGIYGVIRETVDLSPVADAAGWASWEGPGGANTYTGNPATWTSCQIHLLAAAFETTTIRAGGVTSTQYPLAWVDPPAECAVFVHEWGHLLGHRHTRRRNDLMNPRSGFIPRPCRRL